MRIALLVALLASAVSAEGARPVLPSGRARCDLSRLERLPPLLLIGENHCSAHSTRVKAAMARLGAEGRLYAAFEVGDDFAAYPWEAERLHRSLGVARAPGSRIYGVESPFAHGLVLTYLGASGRYPNCSPQPRLRALEKLAAYTRINPYLERAWRETRVAASADPAAAPAAAALARALSEPDGVSPRAEPAELEALPLLARRLNQAYVELANREFLPAMGLQDELPATPSGQDLLGWYAALEVEDVLVVDLRDRDMADAIAAVYCAAASEDRAVVASVGAAHLPGIGKDLAAWSAGRIPLEKAWSANLSEPILDRLEALASPSRVAGPGRRLEGLSAPRFD